MVSYRNLKENEARFESLTGLSVSAFESLHSHAASYGMRQSQCNVWLHMLPDMLQQTLKASGHLPQRDPSKLKQALAGVKEVFIDVTERRQGSAKASLQ